ncbi:MAG TPA: glycoside hydrolase N-terminal domain-containing protein, partial [Candidatus Bathyarchaeia archaeon]|nr:glycoside hydrolase N-terminal domain-containing protein [Candidatus Bathyarchaeia archaeon]
MNCLTILLAATLLASSIASAELMKGPASELKLDAPIERWDEAVPLGNGLMGGLMWGGVNVLKVSLDRGDLWDLRRPDIVLQPDWNYATIKRLVAERNQKEISRLFDAPYNDIPYPTKLPVARLELVFPDDVTIRQFSLNLSTATGRVDLTGGRVQAVFDATRPVAFFDIRGPKPEPRFVASTAVKKLGYPPAELGRDGDFAWVIQSASEGDPLKYAVVLKEQPDGSSTRIAVTITSTADGPDPLEVAKKRLDDALIAHSLDPHRRWWAWFWDIGGVRVPDPDIQRQYDLVQYFYGAASRRGAPPIPLQGVWTADEGELPPWKGDYHHDLNTQLTYWAYLAAGHFDEGLSFIDFMWDLLPEHREFARSFYGTPGAAVPGVMTLDGKALAGWAQYSLSPTDGAWAAHTFYRHWRYTMDDTFLRTRAYPYMAELARCYEELLEPGANGKLKLPLSSSPEIHDNTLKAWMTPNTNFDLALLRWHFGALAEMAQATSDTAAAARWNATLNKLDEFAVEPDTMALKLSPDESLTESHRHHSQVMAIHPLGLITIEGSDRDRAIIDGTLDQMERLGTRNWCGYSFSWMSCIAARAGKPDMALKYLDIFVKNFISRNGFHLNGDQKGGEHSNFKYRPFTLEGNFAAAEAVHEMLLQSWGGGVRVFPAVPDKWQDVQFASLHAEGGWKVSAIRKAGKTVSLSITANRDAQLRLRDPFPGANPTWNL